MKNCQKPCAIADQKVALQEMLLHHQGNQANYAPNLLPSSPRTLTSSTDSMLLTHTVLTSHLGPGTPNIQSQQPIGQTLVPLPHEHSPGNMNTLYSSLQSAPKKRKLSQDGLVHVKQVQRVKFFYCHDYTKVIRYLRNCDSTTTGKEYNKVYLLFVIGELLKLYFYLISRLQE